MTQLGDINRNSRTAGFTAWLALAAVLLLQISTAAHEAQHSANDVGEVCEVCVQLEGGSTTDAIANQSVVPVSPAVLNNDRTDAPVVAFAFRTPQLRAPPALI